MKPYDSTDIARLQTTKKSYAVETLGRPGIEGYSEELYSDIGRGIAIGNGINLGQQSIEGLTKLGVHPHVVDKIKSYGIVGLTGDKAERRLKFLQESPKYNKLTKGEVAHLANVVTDHTTNGIIKRIGEDNWNAKPEGAQLAAMSLYHMYGNKWFNHKSFEQFKSNDFGGLKRNMEDYGDKTKGVAKGVNARHRRVSAFIPDPDLVVAVGETRDQEMARLANEMRQKGEAAKFVKDEPLSFDKVQRKPRKYIPTFNEDGKYIGDSDRISKQYLEKEKQLREEAAGFESATK